MKINWKDLTVTALFILLIVFLTSTLLSPYDFLNLTEQFVFLFILIMLSSISFIFYINRNKPDYKEIAAVSFLSSFAIYLLYSIITFYISGTLDFAVALVFVFALIFVSSPFLYLYLRKKPKLIQVISIFLVFFLVYLFYTGMIFFLFFWFGFGILFSLVYTIFGLFWRFLLKLLKVQ